MTPGRLCPERVAYDNEVEWENAHDGGVTIAVYKSARLRTKGVKHYRDISRVHLRLRQAHPDPPRRASSAGTRGPLRRRNERPQSAADLRRTFERKDLNAARRSRASSTLCCGLMPVAAQ
jgi:hypothetical protein